MGTIERRQEVAAVAAQPTQVRTARRLGACGLLMALIVVGCTTDNAEPTTTELPTTVAEPTSVPTAPPTAAPLLSTAEPPITPVSELPSVRSVGDLEAAKPGTFVVAQPGAGVPLADGATIVPVYDEPHGEPRVLVDANNIDNVKLAFPLRNPTVFNQPLVLRVVAGTPTDEWILVQAPTRPHRRYVWVRAEHFAFGQSDLRIEVDLGRDGRFALFDGERELISNLAVYGRDSRPTVLHDTYVEQAFDASVLSPAYGTYILTIASYSESLGTFGGGGVPGQSLHGTNQPELVGQRVSSGGIRVPNEIIEFVYRQPDILGASVVIYDSTGIGRDAAIALQRNQQWERAATLMFSQTDPPPIPVASYS